MNSEVVKKCESPLLGALLIAHPNLLLDLILILSLPRLWSLFRSKSVLERRYFEVSAAQRFLIGVHYIGLAGALAWGMTVCSPLHRQVQTRKHRQLIQEGRTWGDAIRGMPVCTAVIVLDSRRTAPLHISCAGEDITCFKGRRGVIAMRSQRMR